MGGWSNGVHGWQRTRRGANTTPRWTAADIGLTVAGFAIHWELGVAFLGLKLWQEASGHSGSALSFARGKWDALVNTVRPVLSGQSWASIHVGPRSSGNHAFDTWRRDELARIDSERDRLRRAERDFAAYRDELLHAKDREDFDRFMQNRDARRDISDQ